MAAISRIQMWRDPGYTEGCLRHPSAQSLSNPDVTINGPINPSVSEFFSVLKLRRTFDDLLGMCYLRADVAMASGESKTFWGWVDSVELSSDTSGSPMTIVRWHVDLWRTYHTEAEYGNGLVVRRKADATIPPQTYPSRYMDAGIRRELIEVAEFLGLYFVIFNATKTVSGKSTTTTYCYPVSRTSPTENFKLGPNVIAPSMNQTLRGELDELLGFDPSAIYAMWMSPVPPSPIHLGVYYTMEHWGSISNDGYACWELQLPTDSYDMYHEWSKSWVAETTDTATQTILGFDGSVVATLPWGLKTATVYYRLVNADTSAYLVFRFVMSSNMTKLDASALGLEVSIPLPRLGLTSNALSSYVYSGQQEYDRARMDAQRDQALYSGLLSILGGGVQGGAAGALQGATPNSAGVAIGAGMGGAIGAGAAIAGSAIATAGNYLIAGVMNDRMMDLTVSAKSRQTSNLTLPSSGPDWWMRGAGVPVMVPLVIDWYSETQRDADIEMYGAHVQEPTASCEDLIRAGGPMQIRNLEVGGPIPPEAKRYLREQFAGGVIIE